MSNKDKPEEIDDAISQEEGITNREHNDES